MKKITSLFILTITMVSPISTKSSRGETKITDKNKKEVVSKTGKKAWKAWTQKLKDNYQKKFSVPSATHHVYVKKGEEAWIDGDHSYFRWVPEKCKNCRYQVKRIQEKKLLLVDHKTKKSTNLAFGQKTKVPGEKSLFIHVFTLPNGEIRLFLHDLSLKNLKEKRKRYFFEYNQKAIWPGRFYWLKKPKPVIFKRSDGSTKEMSMVAQIRYEKEKLKGFLSVHSYGEDDSHKKQNKAMLLFRDYSNGKKTYGAGRFLTLFLPKAMGQLKDGDKVSINFNFAYNPPCAVSTGFHCPLPQDLVETELLVGESYKKIKN